MKTFSFRQVTQQLDDSFKEDIKEFAKSNAKPFIDEYTIQQESELLLEWEIFKSKKIIQYLAFQTFSDNCLKLCICNFKQERQTTMEFWVKLFYDIINQEQYGLMIRKKMISSFVSQQQEYISDLKNRKWPQKWENIKTDSCLNLEIIKLYIEYVPIRLFIAQQINKKTNIIVDIGRMPFISESFSMRLCVKENTFFPITRLPKYELFNQLTNSKNIFCQNIYNFIEQITPIAIKILELLNQNNNNGRTINIYGTQYIFLFNLILSLRALGAQKIYPIIKGIKRLNLFDCYLKNKIYNKKYDIILTQLTQDDINVDLLTDIKNNYKEGYVAFISKKDEDNKKFKRLIIIFSESRLKFGKVEDFVQFYKCPDSKISEILEMNDFNFLTFYANMLMNHGMLEFRTFSFKTKTSNIMYCMWTYVIAKFFYENFDLLQTEITNSQKKNVNQQELMNFEINISDNEQSNDNINFQEITKKLTKQY